MTEMSPAEMDQQLKEYAGKMLDGTMTQQDWSDMQWLQVRRRNTIFPLHKSASALARIRRARTAYRAR